MAYSGWTSFRRAKTLCGANYLQYTTGDNKVLMKPRLIRMCVYMYMHESAVILKVS